MNKSKITVPQPFHFESSHNYQHFHQFSLSKQPLQNLDFIKHSQQNNKKYRKVKALIAGCIIRNQKLLYRGQKYYYQDLQTILDTYKDIASEILKGSHIPISKSQDKIYVQCHNCAAYTEVWKYCSTCEHIHYCQESCQMKSKFTHVRQQCRPRAFPNLFKAMQIQIHVGTDIGQDVHLFFQHEVSMSLLIRGQKLLKAIQKYFNEKNVQSIVDDYYVKSQKDMIVFQKKIKSHEPGNQKLKIDTIGQISQIYIKNKVVFEIEVFLLENGGIFNRNIRQIHDNSFREILIFFYP